VHEAAEADLDRDIRDTEGDLNRGCPTATASEDLDQVDHRIDDPSREKQDRRATE
jgi:hypothetical protein